jgi:periplasmic protein TonB
MEGRIMAQPADTSDDRKGPVGAFWLTQDESFSWGVFAGAFIVAFLMHAVLGVGANQAPTKKLAERIEMAVYVPPPPPPPPPVVEAPPPEPEKPKPKPKDIPPPPKDAPPPPPPSNDKPPPEPPSEPVPVLAGLNLNSTVTGGASFQAPVGNTTYGDPNGQKRLPPDQIKPYAGGEPGGTNFQAVRRSAQTKQATVLKDYKTPYPKDLLDAKVEGTVKMEISISKTGNVVAVKKIKSSGNATLDALALEAIKKFKFRPAEVDGTAVDANLTYTYTFETYD